MEDAYIRNADLYCADCVGFEDAEFVGNSGESDSPVHCADCGVPLEHSLTSEGIRYALDRMRESLARSTEDRNRVIPKPGTAEERMTYYHGSRHIEIVRDWAKHLQGYSLNPEDREFVETFLEETEQ